MMVIAYRDALPYETRNDDHKMCPAAPPIVTVPAAMTEVKAAKTLNARRSATKQKQVVFKLKARCHAAQRCGYTIAELLRGLLARRPRRGDRS